MESAMNYRNAGAAQIAARINEIEKALTATDSYSPATGHTHFTATGDHRAALERELGQARHVFLGAAQAREVTND